MARNGEKHEGDKASETKKKCEGWLKLYPINYFKIRKSTPFLEVDPEFFHTCSVSVNGRSFFFLFFRQIFGRFFFFFNFWALSNAKFLSKKNTHTFRGRNGLIERVCKNCLSTIYLKNGVDFWAFVRKTCVICLIALYYLISV